jgi:M6 family metalloprotease-like protein/uncharacterized repeat protein (TIGR01451 family)
MSQDVPTPHRTATAARPNALPFWRLALSLSIVSAAPAPAMHPPTPRQIADYRADGSLDERLAQVKRTGNHLMAPSLVNRLRERLARLAGGERRLPPLPSAWSNGLPAAGRVKTLVLLIDFPDYRHPAGETVNAFKQKMFGNGDSAAFPYESIRNFYARSSFGKLTITGNVLGWYRAARNRNYYRNQGDPQVLIKEALAHYDAKGHDFSQYDNDGDGDIDALYVKWTGPDSGWGGFWWARVNRWRSSDPFRADGKKPDLYVWSWTANPEQEGSTGYQPKTDIHETGHLLGLPDYYDYDDSVGPKGGLGGLDIMDGIWGDHNCFSKFALGWLEPTVIAAGAERVLLKPGGAAAEAVLIMPKADPDRSFAEYYMAQYRKRGVGNDPADYPNDGLLIWHVDARLNASGRDYRFDNSYTGHKLLKLMEADGKGEIERGDGNADGGDFFRATKSFGPLSKPSSRAYSGAGTGVQVKPVGKPGDTFAADYRVIGADLAVSVTASAPSLPVGEVLDYTATVTNTGTGVAYRTVLTDVLPDGAVPATDTEGCKLNQAGTTISCNLGTLQPGAAATRRFSLRHGIAGLLSNRVKVKSASYDGVQKNNQATARITVE